MSSTEVINKKENQTNYIVTRTSELLYLGFFGIMLFTKGIGLYDGQNAYKLFLVLAFLCIAVKMCLTEYSYKEWAVISILLILSIIVYRVSGEKGILICTVTVVAMKNVSLKRAFRVGLCVWSVAMAGRFLVSLIWIENVEIAVQTKNITGAVLRYFMGYPHPNVLHISYLVLAAFVIYCVKETYSLKHLLVLAAGNLFVFFYSYSYTGALIVMIYICLSYYVSKREISKIEYFIVELLFPFCILFSIIFPLVLRGKAFELADKIFNNRINFARHFLTLENMSLVGNNLAEITTDVITMDNAFVFALVIYGIPVFLLICAGYLRTVSQYVKQRKNIELAMICCFLVAGITEPFLFNTSFKNLTLLFLGEQLFQVLRKKEPKQKEIAIFKNKDKCIALPVGWIKTPMNGLKGLWEEHQKAIWTVGMITALLFCIMAGVFYQPTTEVLEIAKENLLVFERIRVMITAFLFGFIAAAIVMCAGMKIVGSSKKHI